MRGVFNNLFIQVDFYMLEQNCNIVMVVWVVTRSLICSFDGDSATDTMASGIRHLMSLPPSLNASLYSFRGTFENLVCFFQCELMTVPRFVHMIRLLSLSSVFHVLVQVCVLYRFGHIIYFAQFSFSFSLRIFCFVSFCFISFFFVPRANP